MLQGHDINDEVGASSCPGTLNMEARAEYDEWAVADNVAKQEACNSYTYVNLGEE
jgi:acyl-CoA-binding protein